MTSICQVMIHGVPGQCTKKFGSWGQDKWNGTFQIKWTFVKDIPNNQFRHIVLANNENKVPRTAVLFFLLSSRASPCRPRTASCVFSCFFFAASACCLALRLTTRALDLSRAASAPSAAGDQLARHAGGAA